MGNENKTWEEKNLIVEIAKEAIKNGSTKKSIYKKYGIASSTLNTYLEEYENNGPFQEELGFDATPTWSGFTYQGKVAIYYSLKTINENKLSKTSCETLVCKNCDLEIEAVEDFSIKDINDRTNYYSIHQVKAYSSQNSSSYTEAIENIKNSLKSLSPNSKCPQGYLHIMQPANFLQLPSNIHIYCYDVNGTAQCYCELAEIEDLIKKEIIKYIYRNIDNQYDEDRDEIDIAYLFIMNQIDILVRERHAKITKFGKKGFQIESYNFCNICKVLNSNLVGSQRYWMAHLKNVFVHSYEYFVQLNQNATQILSDESLAEACAASANIHHLKSYIEKLWNHYCSPDDFYAFCKTICPHIKSGQKLTASSYHTLLQEDALREAYFENLNILLHQNCEYDENGLFKIETKKYLVTNINNRNDGSSASQLHIENIKTQILNNPSNVETLYEVDVLVTKELEIESLQSTKITDIIPEPDSEGLIEYTKWKKWEQGFTHIKDIEIISQKNLRERLDIE